LATRKKRGTAETDYVIQHENQGVPVEVKAGRKGSLKSLREFISEKNRTLALRINSDKPSFHAIETTDFVLSTGTSSPSY